jgi:DNA repair protein NreA
MSTASDIKKRLEENWNRFLISNRVTISSGTLIGSTPPSIFVGRHGYPKVKVGPMLAPLHGDTTILDMPEMWIGKSIEEIVDYRLSLIRGVSSININTTSGKYLESLQELAMAKESSESEATFEKKPIADTDQNKDLLMDTESAPFGPIALLKTFKTSSSLSVDQKIENAFYDRDLHAADAVTLLYNNGIEISKIQRVLSMGMLGTQKNRKLVPTRWSISATDDVISDYLIKNIRVNTTIDFYEVYKYSHIGNHYCIILIPEQTWIFEMLEAWFDKNGNLVFGAEFEDATGLDHYPSIAGAYFAARLGIAEHYLKVRKSGGALVLREIHPEYVLPVGVWQVREGVREALNGDSNDFDSFEQALSFACISLSASEKEWQSHSKFYKNTKDQTRITDFLHLN